MISLNRPVLDDDVIAALSRYQNNIDVKVEYDERVNEAKVKFKTYNIKSNYVFEHVKQKLLTMCKGLKRCHYCEDNTPDEVEHFKPKDLYPEACFVWTNYLYSCGICNGSFKNNKFKVITNQGVLEVTRQRGAAITPPQNGHPLLIDPSIDNPMNFMELDFGTFYFVEINDQGTIEYERAKYTIELLGLNSRDVLVEARKSAFGSFLARLKEYVALKETGAPANELENLKNGLCIMSHFTVWEEMKRQRLYQSQLHRELNELFMLADEVFTW